MYLRAFETFWCATVLSLVALSAALTSDVSCAGAPPSPSLFDFVYESAGTGTATGRVTLNSAAGQSADARPMEAGGAPPGSRGAAVLRRPGGGGATYTPAALLQLRGTAVGSPPDPVVALCRRLGLRRRRHRGVRAGRKSHRPINVIVPSRHGCRRRAETGTDRDRRRCLSQPPRLTHRQTTAPASQLRVAHLNVRSLTRHLDDVNHLLLTEKLDVLCLSETWLTESMDDRSLVFPGYSVARRDRRGRNGGGVAILHRSNLSAELLTVPSIGSALESLKNNPTAVKLSWAPTTGRRPDL